MSGGEEVDFWSATVQAFAPLQLASPELSPKLLKRPPFRFIHDIVTSINTRFAAYDHIFRPDQLDASCIDSKEKKIEYLTTLVEYVGSLLGKKVDVNVKKIVSGSEPERTNTFLQCLAAAVGYAQQDKAKKKQPTESNRSSDQQVVSQGTANTSANDEGMRKKALVDTASSEQKCEDSERALEKVKLSQESVNFFQKLSAFGQFRLDEETSVKDIGESIVAMFKELQEDNAETQPTPLPEEALETAIKRQMESVQQLQALEEENREILNKLMVLLT